MDELKNWLLSLGHAPQGLNLDGKFVRFGKDKEFWVWAKQFEFTRTRGSKKVVSASFGNWKTGEKIKWSTASRLPKHESELITNEMNRQIEIDRAEKEKEHIEAAKLAFEKFNYFKWAASTPYTERKNVVVDPKCRVSGNLLVVPLYDVDGKFWTYQTINPDGEKRFFTGGKKRGNFFTIGDMADEIIICEGYATGYSLHKSTGKCVVVAFDAGSLPPVAKALRGKYPNAKFTIGSDNDEVGEKKAREAAALIGGEIVFPPEGFKDFNDAGGALTEVHEFIVDETTPLPHLDEGGAPLSTIENVQEMLKRLNIKAYYDVIRKTENVLIPNKNFSLDNKANVSLSHVVSWAARFHMPTGRVAEFVSAVAEDNQFNPVAEWIMMKPWDGVDRLQDFYNTIKSPDETKGLKEILLKRWCISAVAAAMSPHGVSAHGVLVLQGGQGLGKTSWFNRLAPREMGLLKDGLILRPDNKDSVKTAISYWMVELGEIEGTFKKADMAALKAFLTQNTDVIRLPFARKDSEFVRRTVFFASVNQDEFLNDNTGNRRFWSIECLEINYQHSIDMQQFWAQIHGLWQNGEPWVLQANELEMLNKANEDFETQDPIIEDLQTGYDWTSDKKDWQWVTTTQALTNIGIKFPTKGDLIRAGREIRKLNGNQKRRSNGVKRILVPLPLLFS